MSNNKIREIEFNYRRYIRTPRYWNILVKSICPNQLYRLKVVLEDLTEAYIRKNEDDQKDLVSGSDIIVFLKNIKSVLDEKYKLINK